MKTDDDFCPAEEFQSDVRPIYFRSMHYKVKKLTDINILRLCDVHNIPVATNIATAEALIHALERGDLDWREYMRN